MKRAIRRTANPSGRLDLGGHACHSNRVDDSNKVQAIEALATYHDRVRRDVIPLVGERAGRVLDFGGGVGATAAALKADGIATKATLLDRVAEEFAPGLDVAEAVDLEDIERVGQLLEQHGPFDTILCLDILEHLREPWDVSALLSRALAPGGAMILSLPNANYIGLVGPLVLQGRFEYRDAGVLDRTHLRWFTRRSMIDLARGAGLEVERVEPAIYGRSKQALNLVTFGLFERFLATQYRIRASKP